MLEPREIQGYWWLPFMPDGKIPGTLHFSQADIRLELLGGFARPLEETRPEESDEGEESREVVVSLDSFIEYQPRISGVAQNGKPITLERCNGRSLQLGFPQFGSSAYGPHFVLVGAEYAPDEEVAFDEIAIRFSDLDVWASTSGFDQRMIFDDSRTNVERLETTFTPPGDVEAKLGEGTTAKISFAWTWSGQRPITTESHIAQTATLRLLFDEPANTLLNSGTFSHSRLVDQSACFPSMAFITRRPTPSPTRLPELTRDQSTSKSFTASSAFRRPRPESSIRVRCFSRSLTLPPDSARSCLTGSQSKNFSAQFSPGTST